MSEIKNSQYSKILVPIDGSENSLKAYQKALSISKQTGATIDLLNVIDISQFLGLADNDLVYRVTAEMETMLNNLVDESIAKGLPKGRVSMHVRYGNPKTVITKDFIVDHGNDVIVIGATGMNALERFLIGSVVSAVILKAPVDVLVVKK